MTSPAAAVFPPETTFFLSKGGETFGPHSAEDIRSFLENGAISGEDYLWTEGMEQWVAIGEVVDEPLQGVTEAWAPEAEGTRAISSPAPIWARVGPDGMPRRLSIGLVTAIVLHIFLLVSLSLAASVIFRLNTDAPAATAPEPAPLEVAMVDEPDPPPPEPVAPPPPPDDPPPPPAVPDVPIPTDMAPPTPIDIPQPVIAPPTTLIAPVALLAPPAPRPMRHVRQMAVESVAPVNNTPVDVGPSDYLYAPPPSYPYAARRDNEEGTVVLLVSINDAGAPMSVTIDQSSGYSILDAVAQNAVREYRFRPGNNREFRVPITFQEK